MYVSTLYVFSIYIYMYRTIMYVIYELPQGINNCTTKLLTQSSATRYYVRERRITAFNSHTIIQIVQCYVYLSEIFHTFIFRFQVYTDFQAVIF